MIKKIIKKLVPRFIIEFKDNYISKKNLKKFSNLETSQVFERIYNDKLWSTEESKATHKFYSGIGSHNEEFTKKYIAEVSKFLRTFPEKPSVVDLGCGDFIIGSQLRKDCDKYIAVDIFEDLIEANKKKFKNLDVQFQTLDITKDKLPISDICFIRQVLQHLSNDLIKKFLHSIKDKYKYLIITEHLPSSKTFKPNIDITTGPYIRLIKNSGVELTKEPFNLKVLSEKIICDIYPKKIKGFKGILNTKILQLQ